jgi:hypothetical protein
LTHRGNPTTYFGESIVAFIDILGYTESLLNNWGIQDNSPIIDLLEIREKVNSINNSIPGMQSNALPPGYDPNKNYSYKTVIHSISDSFTVSCALPKDLNQWHITIGYMAVYNAIKVIQQCALTMGYIIRGGIEIDTVYWDENLIMGPAYIYATKIESRIARTARIVLGPNLMQSMKIFMHGREELYNNHMTLDSGFSMFRVLNCSDGLVMMNPYYEPTESPNRVANHKLIYNRIKHLMDQCNTSNTQEKYTELLNFYSNLDNPDFASISDLNISLELMLKKLEEINLGVISQDEFIAMENNIPLRRNAPCPCGSGNKYKNCHGKIFID